MPRQEKPVTIKVQTGNRESLENAHLYVFDKEGQLLEMHPLGEGEVTIRTNADDIEGNVQMLIAPALSGQGRQPDINPEQLKRLGGYQPSIRLDVNNQIIIVGLPKFPPIFWDWCLITGTISKSFNIDGQNKILPVCDARVHICEVDRIHWWWWRIPPHIITELGRKLKDIILNPDLIPHPIPEPDPKSLRSLGNSQFSAATRMDANPLMRLMGKSQLRKMSKPPSRTESLPTQHLASSSIALSDEVKSGLLSSTASIVSDTIRNNFQLLHPYICLWPQFWPWFYRCEDIATVYTDCNGRFSFEYLNIQHDKDIYVWVEVNINGQWITVYRPPLACGTNWNYSCGSDINVTVTDPRVVPCNCGQQLHGEIVWFRSIGESATALHIEQSDGNTVSVQGASIANVGCTDLTDSHRISPFGGRLNFKLLFGDGFPTSNITHYRWQKTNVKDSALNNVQFPSTTGIDGMVQKTYFVITQDTQGHFHFQTKAVTLGAEGTGQNIGYRIPHWDIYQDPGVPASDKLLTIQWTSPDFWSASIDSHSLIDGLWRFDLELLTLDSGGNFQVVDVPKQVFQVSRDDNSGDSVDAPNTYLRPAANSAQARNLEVKVRIDNAPCNADIQDASIIVNSLPQYSGKCGFLHYTDFNQLVHISFMATHPRNFAKFSFGVVRGNNTTAITPSVDRNDYYVLSSADIYTLSGGIFAHDAPVSQLNGSCPQAAFSENLHVTALATDGTRQLYEYDDSDTNAFALSTT